MYGYYGIGGGVVAAVVVALIGTILAAVYLFGPQKRSRLSGFALKLYEHVNFQHYIIPVILKFLYVFTALFMVINGLVMLFYVPLAGLAQIVLGPLAARIVYELIMMLFSIHDGIQETNRLLRGDSQSRRSNAQYQQSAPPQQESQPRHYPGGYDPMGRS